MAVELVKQTFNRVGRKTEGEAAATYEAIQIAEDEATGEPKISTSDASAFMTDALEVFSGDLHKVIEAFVLGANHKLRLEAGGYTPQEKAAKALIKSGLPQFKGKTVEEVVAILANINS